MPDILHIPHRGYPAVRRSMAGESTSKSTISIPSLPVHAISSDFARETKPYALVSTFRTIPALMKCCALDEKRSVRISKGCLLHAISRQRRRLLGYHRSCAALLYGPPILREAMSTWRPA